LPSLRRSRGWSRSGDVPWCRIGCRRIGEARRRGHSGVIRLIRDSRAIAVGVIVAFLSACQTTYNDTWLVGSVKAEQIAFRTYEVTAYVNAFTPASRANEFVMLKSAEVALENKANRFAVMELAKNRAASASGASRGIGTNKIVVATIVLLEPFETGAGWENVYDAKQVYEEYKHLKKKEGS